jgi:hypothetical protein
MLKLIKAPRDRRLGRAFDFLDTVARMFDQTEAMSVVPQH